jgi:molybdopterin-guanine dinucleotide biosynthesis protein A
MWSEKDMTSPLNGLVLAGGKSRRMGQDKTTLKWFDREHRYYVADLLQMFCAEVFIGCSEERMTLIDPAYPVITDRINDAGPAGSIYSALLERPDAAWLVLACDLPLLDMHTLKVLTSARDREKIATAFRSPHDGLPEPLAAIWEPAALEHLANALQQGVRCPRKVLLNAEIKLTDAPDPRALMNVNTPEQKEEAEKFLKIKVISS